MGGGQVLSDPRLPPGQHASASNAEMTAFLALPISPIFGEVEASILEEADLPGDEADPESSP